MEQIIQDMIAKHAEKIDLFLIGKTILEIVIFFFVMKFVNKALHVFFDKLISRIEDSELGECTWCKEYKEDEHYCCNFLTNRGEKRCKEYIKQFLSEEV